MQSLILVVKKDSLAHLLTHMQTQKTFHRSLWYIRNDFYSLVSQKCKFHLPSAISLIYLKIVFGHL